MFISYAIQLLPGWKSKSENVEQTVTAGFLLVPIKQTTKLWNLGTDEGWTFEIISFFNSANTNSTEFAYGYSNNAQPISTEDFDRLLGKRIGKSGKFGSLRLRMAWVEGTVASHREFISMFLRDSKTLDERDFLELNQLKFVVDAKGIAVIEQNILGSDRQIRLLHALCLAGAYQTAMNDATERLSAATNNTINSEKNLKDWSVFLARFYSAEPVRSSTVELMHFYTAIRNRLKIDFQYKELTEQLRLHAEIVSLDRRENDSVLFNKFQRRLGFLAILISIIGIAIALLAVSPDQAKKSINGWMSCAASSWQKCSQDSETSEKAKEIRFPAKSPNNVPARKSRNETQ